MKTLILPILALSLSVNAKPIMNKQLPLDNYDYTSNVDAGFDQYKSKSLLKSGKIALTFDDGPHITRTPRLLDMLKKYNVKATFFVLTKKVNSKTLPILKRIVREGHLLGSHHEDHENNNNKSEGLYESQLYKSVTKIENIVKDAGGNQNGIYYRFPYGAYGKSSGYHHFNVMKDVSQQIFGENCINFAFWDIDSSDWGPPLTADMIAQNVISLVNGGIVRSVKMKKGMFGKARYKIKKEKYNHPPGGGVVLIHDIHEKSLQATEILLRRAQNENIKIVPLNTVKEYSFGQRDCRI